MPFNNINDTDQEKLLKNENDLQTEDNTGNIVTNATAEEKKDVDIVLYKRRWWAVIMFGFVGFLANLIWNTWGPISESAEAAFGWNTGDVALLANWGPITYIISAMFLAWLMDKKGTYAYLYNYIDIYIFCAYIHIRDTITIIRHSSELFKIHVLYLSE